MKSAPNSLESRIQELHSDYTNQLPGKISRIQIAWNNICEQGWSEEHTSTISTICHGLAGSAKTFGFSALSKSARVLEELLEETQRAQGTQQEALATQISQMMHTIAHHASRPDRRQGLFSRITMTQQTEPQPINRTVAIVDSDREFATNLATQMGYFDLQAHTYTSTTAFLADLNETLPGILVISAQLSKGNGIAVASEAASRLAERPRILISSDLDDMKLRLACVRAGGEAFLVKPFEATQVIALINKTDTCPSKEPYRVMVVDDSLTMSQLFTLTLEQAGMDVRTVNDPMDMLNVMLDFHPELILLDMYMPQCDGDDLAKVIRQHEAFFSTPIVFLSAETDFERQLSALSTGGDDFLTKPIEPAHLVQAVSSRVQRSRQLHSLMVRDGLTGLLNHTESKRQLDILLERAKRANTPLCFAMLDIDHFKRVNDAHGHPVGDRVIKSLSHFLQQRLRKTDVVGRYGGEEFVIIFPDTTESDGQRVMEELREKFAMVTHHAGDQSFQCTFSCGIATFPHFSNATEIVDRADQALYSAKNQGRNKVIAAAHR